MQKHFKFFLFVFVLISAVNTANAQLTDLARVEYSYIPKNNSVSTKLPYKNERRCLPFNWW